MTTYHFSRSGLLAGALLMAFTLLSSAHAESVAAKVESLKGSAFYDNGNGAVALAAGAEISAGSLVTTSPDSEAVLRLGTSVLRVFGGTTVSLDRLNQEATSLELLSILKLISKPAPLLGRLPSLPLHCLNLRLKFLQELCLLMLPRMRLLFT